MLDARGIVRAQRAPQVVERRSCGRIKLAGRGGAERVEPQPADIGPPPLLLTRLGPRKCLKPRERLATPLDQPCGLVALAEKSLENLFGETARVASGHRSHCTASHRWSVSSIAQSGWHVNRFQIDPFHMNEPVPQHVDGRLRLLERDITNQRLITPVPRGHVHK